MTNQLYFQKMSLKAFDEFNAFKNPNEEFYKFKIE